MQRCFISCLEDKKPVYTIKTMGWQGKGHLIYDCLMLPFQNGRTEEIILCLMHFDIKEEELAKADVQYQQRYLQQLETGNF